MKDFCDMHFHLLPGVDDGPATMEQTLLTLQEARRQHIDRIIVTPHFHPGRYMVTSSQIFDVLEKVREECRRQNLDITLYPGQECYYYSGLADGLNRKEILTLANSRYVLVEFEPDCLFSYLQSGLRDLQSNGYMPILAHFERYRCLQDMDNLLQIRQTGVLLQMNYSALLKDSFFHRLPWKGMVQKGLVDYLGSDCHGIEFRPLQVREADQWLQSKLSPRLLHKIRYSNIEKILDNNG